MSHGQRSDTTEASSSDRKAMPTVGRHHVTTPLFACARRSDTAAGNKTEAPNS
jgi:hypothetical protein